MARRRGNRGKHGFLHDSAPGWRNRQVAVTILLREYFEMPDTPVYRSKRKALMEQASRRIAGCLLAQRSEKENDRGEA